MNGDNSKPQKHLYGFGPYRLDAGERVLFREGRPVPLTPKVVEILILLVENHGHITEKEELLGRVWPDTFVAESALAKNVSVLRKALGGVEDAYIETVAKRGYRFVAEVTTLERESAAVQIETARIQAPPSRSLVLVLAGAAAFLAAGLFGWQRWQPPSPESGSPSKAAEASSKARLVVLPFENLSGDESQQYFADGLTEEMITQLSRVYPERLAVIARTSAMKYKGMRLGVAEIGSDLHVDYILEGSVRREGNRVRITAQLVRVSDQTHLWAETYDRDVGEVLSLQGDVALIIAGRIGIELTGEDSDRLASAGPNSPEAYEDYLKGRFFWNKMTVEGLQKAIEHFESAIRRDPEYAEAHAGLADSYASLGLWGLPGQEALGRAKNAAEAAIVIRESLAEGHASRAFIAMSYEWDWETAEREFRRALALDPGCATAHHRYGYYLMLKGRWEEAGAELKKAQELDPLSMTINANVGFRLYLMRQYDAAIDHWTENLEMDPNFPLMHGYLGMAYVMSERYPEALAAFERAKGTPGVTAALGYVYGVMGRTQEAEKQLAALREVAKREFVPAFYVALLYTGLGDMEQAFSWLEKAHEERSGYLMEIHVDPMFDPLRSDPRFPEFVRRLGLEATQPTL
jgi:TolB-like protein/DNA-binding winged helix-turn-helix (wHTH) protein/Tfp pilus assembly protein PilF